MIPQAGSIEESIYKALSEAFENIVFEEVVLADVEKNRIPEISLDGWWSRIQMLSPLPWGHIVLIVPSDLMNRFTEAILALPGDTPTDEQNADNLGELLNTICGRLMSLRSSPEKTFRIGLPEVGRGMSPEMKCPFRCVDCLVGDQHVYLLSPEAFWDDIVWTMGFNFDELYT